MPSLEISKGIRVGFNELLREIGKLDTVSLEKFAGEINNLLARRKRPIPDQEAELLRKINEAIPQSIKQQQRGLYAKLQADTISDKENKELELLNDLLENKSAERILLMGELALLRKISLEEVAAQLKEN